MLFVFHIFIAVALLPSWFVAVMVCGHHGIGLMTTLMNHPIISAGVSIS